MKNNLRIENLNEQKLADCTPKFFLEHVLFHRKLMELCIVGILHYCHEDGKQYTPQELLEQIKECVESEKRLITKYPEVAIKLYTVLNEGRRGDARKEMNHIMKFDLVGHYKELIEREKLETQMS